MLYLDTSFIVPLVIAENSSEAVESFVLNVKPGELATSLWTLVETASLVSRKIRIGELAEADASAVRRVFDRILSETFDLISPTAADFAKAVEYLEVPKTGLKAGDALHLAIAANRRARKILSLDRGLVAAGKMLRLPVARGIT